MIKLIYQIISAVISNIYFINMDKIIIFLLHDKKIKLIMINYIIIFIKILIVDNSNNLINRWLNRSTSDQISRS